MMNLIPGKPLWMFHPDRREHEEGYTLFRKTVTVDREVSYHLIVSGDNRFTFFLDGKVLGRGPLRGNLEHRYYDEYEGTLAPGEHIFAAEVLVWRSGWRKSTSPWSELHAGGGFFTAGYAGEERMELSEGWLTSVDEGRHPLPWEEPWAGWTPAPAMDEIDFRHYDPEWMREKTPEGKWVPPVRIGAAGFRDLCRTDPNTPWLLEKRPLRQMTESFTPLARIISGPEGLRIENGVLRGNCPAGKHAVLLDLGRNQTSMIRFSGSSGKGICRVRYSETLFDPEGHKLRDGTGIQQGYADRLILGGKPWEYDSFWYRTGRFIGLEWELDEPVSDLKLTCSFIHYPFGKLREFHAPEDPVLEKIWNVASHTLLCCSHEHFEDCPYYEQLQYAGDSRIEALVSYAVSGKPDLGKHAIRMIGYSQLSSGFTQSRYPSFFQQIIPGYCLIWVLMLHDYVTLFRDPEFLAEMLPKTETLLHTFERYRKPDGLISGLPGWHFTDWVPGWPSGACDRMEEVPDTVLNLFYAEACLRGAELLEKAGKEAGIFRQRREATLQAVNRLCCVPSLHRYSDVPGKPEYLSLHANVLAVLFGAVPEGERSSFLREITADSRLSPMSLYFSFYLLSAIRQYGTEEELRKQYAPWERMLKDGCTTFPETPRPCRSDCHAWSCAPARFLAEQGRL